MSLQNTDEAFSKMENFVRDLTNDVRSTTGRQQQSRQSGQSTQGSSEDDEPADDTWKNKLVYLGGIAGGGMIIQEFEETRYDSYGNSNKNSYTDILGLTFFGFQANFWPLKFLALEADLGLGISNSEVSLIIPLLIKFGGRPGRMELTGNIGYIIGSGLTVGTTAGFCIGPGVLSLDIFVVPSPLVYIVTAGYKIGVGNKK